MVSFSEFAEEYEGRVEDLERQLAESLTQLNQIMSTGWISSFITYDDREGPTLDQVKEAARRNRDLAALNPHIGNGLELINSYVNGNGIHFDGISSENRGKGVNVQELIDNPINQENYFSTLARKQRQSAFYTDGTVMYYGDDSGPQKVIIPVSIMEITDDLRNPERPSEIWAYRRSWTQKSLTRAPVEKHEWIFRRGFEDKIRGRKSLTYQNKQERIATEKIMFVKRSNPTVGWSYGLSDVQRGISWAEDYRQAMLDGKGMTASMAKIWATMQSNTAAGGSQAAVTMGNLTGAGGMAHMSGSNAMQVLPSAGNAYDFSKLLPLLANFAAGIGVSVIALSMNSGNAGGSYGASKSLERPEQLSTRIRHAYNSELDREVLLWLGANPKKLQVWFDPIIDPTEKYRAEQLIELRLGTGLYSGEEIKRMHAELDGRDPNNIKPVPDGWLIPNNKESLALKAIDTDATGGDPSNGGSFAPTQGSGAKATPTGSGNQKADDIRTNRESVIESMLREMKVDDLMSALASVQALLEKQAKG